MAHVHDDGIVPYYGLPAESLEEHQRDVESYVHSTKTEDRKLCGPSLLRRVGGRLDALAKSEVKPQDLAKDDGFNLMLVLLEKSDYKKQ